MHRTRGALASECPFPPFFVEAAQATIACAVSRALIISGMIISPARGRHVSVVSEIIILSSMIVCVKPILSIEIFRTLAVVIDRIVETSVIVIMCDFIRISMVIIVIISIIIIPTDVVVWKVARCAFPSCVSVVVSGMSQMRPLVQVPKDLSELPEGQIQKASHSLLEMRWAG